MVFKPPPAILQRVMKFKAIKHKDGKFLLWDIPCFISELYTFIYLQRLIEDGMGSRKASSIIYSMGFLQAGKGLKMVVDRFGYAKTIQDKKKLMDFNLGQSEMVGIGSLECVRADFEKEVFIFRGRSPIGEEYRKFFGTQRAPVDHFLRGCLGSMVEWVTKKRCLCIETQCVAMGKRYCEFVVKPVPGWDRKDPLYSNQSVEKVKDMKELGAKIEPYIISPF